MEHELKWSHSEAVSFCKLLEPAASRNGFHVALAGGCLLQNGLRKDLDVVLYRHDGGEHDVKACLEGFRDIGVSGIMEGKWYYRAQFNGKPIDFMFMMRQSNSELS